jgi:methionine-S-sulfoxide reductase
MKIAFFFHSLFFVWSAKASLDTATFAGGCFWCMEHPFEKLAGVKGVYFGYTCGVVIRPDYEQVSSGRTVHYEAIEVVFDSSILSYVTLLEVVF